MAADTSVSTAAGASDPMYTRPGEKLLRVRNADADWAGDTVALEFNDADEAASFDPVYDANGDAVVFTKNDAVRAVGGLRYRLNRTGIASGAITLSQHGVNGY